MAAVSRQTESLRRSVPYGTSALAAAVASGLEFLIARSEIPQLSLVPLSLAVVFGAWLGGLGPGLLALVIAAVAIDLFVFDPGTLLTFGTRAETIVFAAFLGLHLGVCLVGSRTRSAWLRERGRLADAERAAAEARRSAELAVALSQARTPAAAMEAALQEPLHAFAADAAAMYLVSKDGATADVARTIAYADDAAPAAVSLHVKSPVADAVGRGAPVVVDSPQARRQEYGQASPMRYGATVAIPLLIGSRVVAVAQFDFERAREFSDADHEYMEVFAHRAAAALDRTWQYEYALRARIEAEAERARADQEIVERQRAEVALRASEARGRALAARTSRLHGLTAALSEAVTLDAVAHAVVTQGRVAVGATSGEVTLLADEGRTFHTVYAEGGGLITTDDSPLEGGSCASEAVRTRQPVFVASFEQWQQDYPRSASRGADGGYVSSATLPLLVDGTPIGVLAFHFTAPVSFDEEYRALLVSVAQDCAQALDRARLYEAAEQARAAAEAANRLKDEFVSIVSHELRTPLNAILGWTSMLMRGIVDPPVATRALQSVHDNATRQARLIEELLDFSRVSSGRLALAREDIDMRDLIRGVVESLIPETVAKGVSLELDHVPAVRVTGDLRRLEQVFFNLLGNALKFTPEGGRIVVSVRRHEGHVEVQVTDTGRGIPREFLPFVFERFRQGDSMADREHGGLGLGLSIARQLVEAHDGEIRVDSPGANRGSTFTVKLPAAEAGSAQPELITARQP
jgi:signal transduction histidine kinase